MQNVAAFESYFDQRYLQCRSTTTIETEAKNMRLAFSSKVLVIRNGFLQFKVFLKAG